MTQVLNVGEVVGFHAQLVPDKVAVRDLERSLTYAELEERSCRLANAFSGLGLRKGDRVAVYAYNRLEWMEIYTACAKSGVVAVPINFRLTPRELAYIVDNSGARAVLADSDLAARILEVRDELDLPEGNFVQIGQGDLAPGFRRYDDLLDEAAASEPEVSVRPEDPWTIMYTSGTTGRPKGAVRSHQSYALFYLINAVEFGFGRDDVGLCVMPMCHVNSVFYGFVFTYLGATTCVYDRRSFDPEHLLATFDDLGVTFTSLVPTHYIMMLALPEQVRAKYDVRSVQKLLVSSAPARRDTKLAIMEYFRNSRLFEAYGSTEAGLVTLLRPEDQLRKLGSIGREIVGTGRIKLLDDEGNEVPDGEVGELYSLTPTTFDGYHRNPEATRKAFRGRYCTAGDMARRDEDGFYVLVDRKSNMIITGGENVYPSEVEQVLGAHPAVKDVAVIGLPDEKWGEAVTGVVVLHDGASASERELIDFARKDLAGYKCPKRIVFVTDDEMPRTATGKILHRVLRERLGGARET